MLDEKLLLVEGPDDKAIINSLLSIYRIQSISVKTPRDYVDPENTKQSSLGGFEQLRKDVSFVIQSSELKYFGIVVDSDTNTTGRWASVRDKLRECGCDPPKALPKEGAVFNGPRGVRVGVWLMPDNNMTGAMEAFLRQMVPVDDQNWNFAEECVENIPNSVKQKDSKGWETWRDKARLHTWLAWQKSPGKPPESVLQSPPYLDAKARVAQAFVAWVKLLFEIEERV
jgi:hypothetical protein